MRTHCSDFKRFQRSGSLQTPQGTCNPAMTSIVRTTSRFGPAKRADDGTTAHKENGVSPQNQYYEMLLSEEESKPHPEWLVQLFGQELMDKLEDMAASPDGQQLLDELRGRVQDIVQQQFYEEFVQDPVWYTPLPIYHKSDETGDWVPVTADRCELLMLDVDGVHNLVLKTCNYEPSELVNIHSFDALPAQVPPPFQGQATCLVLTCDYKELMIAWEKEPGYDRNAHLARLKGDISYNLRAACWVVVKKDDEAMLQ